MNPPNRTHLPGLRYAKDALGMNYKGIIRSAPTMAMDILIKEAEMSSEGGLRAELQSLCEDLLDAGAIEPTDEFGPDDTAAVNYGLGLALALIRRRIETLEG